MYEAPLLELTVQIRREAERRAAERRLLRAARRA